MKDYLDQDKFFHCLIRLGLWDHATIYSEESTMWFYKEVHFIRVKWTSYDRSYYKIRHLVGAYAFDKYTGKSWFWVAV